MKILVDYDETTGKITPCDNSSSTPYYGPIEDSSWMACEYKAVEPESSDTGVSRLVELKSAGFTTDEIISLDQRGLI